MPDLKRIVVTGSAGNIAYTLLFSLAKGALLGPDQPIALHLLDIPPMEEALEGVKMELLDLASPVLEEIQVGSDPKKMFKDVDYAFLVGAKPRGPGMERKDLLFDNGKIFVEQGKALNEVAKRDVKILVVGNPCNTNCLIAMQNAPDLPKENFMAMTRLDQNRAKSQLAAKAGVKVEQVKQMTIWGNHSSTQVPDAYHATIDGKKLIDVIDDNSWIEGEFVETVQKRGAAIIKARGKSSAASAAYAAIDSMRSAITPTEEGEWFSVGISSDENPYGVREGLIFSFPVRVNAAGKMEIVDGLEWNDFLKEKIALSEKELLEEKELVL